jgi:hypothetical protein
MYVSADPELSQSKPGFGNLLQIVRSALSFWPPDYVQSCLGPWQTWLPPHNPYSEFATTDHWQLLQTLKYLRDISVPSISGAPPRILSTLLPRAIEELFFVQTEVLYRPDYYGDYTSHRDERWFFINGILTNDDIANLNADCLAYLFNRPITLIQNVTDGAVLDLWECALGKEWYGNTANTESARMAFPPIYDALKDPDKKKVVVICHSQGTIIMAILLHAFEALTRLKADPHLKPSLIMAEDGGMGDAVQRARDLAQFVRAAYIFKEDAGLNPEDFEPLTEREWRKLEVYCFATCANYMHYHARVPGCPPVPWMEHFGNEHDLVARLGMLAPQAAIQSIDLEGPFYVRKGAWGHLFNSNYLLPIAECQRIGHKRGGTTNGAAPFTLVNDAEYPDAANPRLYSYINGGSPHPEFL